MLALILWTVIIAAVFCYLKWTTQKIESGAFDRPGSDKYPYIIGNNLPYESKLDGKFHGIEISLPASLPHIFIDATKHQGFSGPNKFVTPDQIVRLEGDFNNFFTAYAVTGTESFALSLLTPDVLQTLIDYCNGMDVEFYHKKLRIISNKRVYHRPDREEPIYLAARKLLSEVDHKFASWSIADNLQANTTELRTQNVPAVRLFGRTVRVSSVIVCAVWIPISLPIWFIVFTDVRAATPSFQTSLFGEILVALLFFPIGFLALFIGAPRGWLKKLAAYFDH